MAQPRIGDVWVAVLADALDGKPAKEIVERDDGFVMVFDARYLLAPFKHWDDANERRAMRFVRGRVLDVGCGGGRVCLHLQDRGLKVVGIDSDVVQNAAHSLRGHLLEVDNRIVRPLRLEVVPDLIAFPSARSHRSSLPVVWQPPGPAQAASTITSGLPSGDEASTSPSA
jgi:SAM-dependent methyltransferase